MYEIKKKIRGDQRLKIYVKEILEKPADLENNLPIIFSYNNLDVKKLECAVNKIVERHDNLRSIYVIENDVLYQIILKSCPIKVTRLNEPPAGNFSIPFDINKAPALRISVYKNTVYADFHHIFIDGFSLGIFFYELNEFYKGNEIKYKLPDIEELIVPDEVYEKNNLFYKQFYPKGLKKTFIKPDYENAELTAGGPADTEFYSLTTEFMSDIKEASKANGVTPNNFTTVAYTLLLSMMTKNENIYIVSDVSARNRMNFRSIGLYTTAVAFSYFVDPEKKVKDFLQEVYLYTKEILKRQNLQMKEILKSNGLTYKDVSDVAFVYQNEMISNIKLNDEVCKITPIAHADTFFAFVLSFFARKDNSVLQLTYRNDYYKRETILHFIDEYIKLLKIMINNTDLLISDVFKLMNY